MAYLRSIVGGLALFIAAELSDMLEVMQSIKAKNINNVIGFKPGYSMLRAYKEAQQKMALTNGVESLDPSIYLTQEFITQHLGKFYGTASK